MTPVFLLYLVNDSNMLYGVFTTKEKALDYVKKFYPDRLIWGTYYIQLKRLNPDGNINNAKEWDSFLNVDKV